MNDVQFKRGMVEFELILAIFWGINYNLYPFEKEFL